MTILNSHTIESRFSPHWITYLDCEHNGRRFTAAGYGINAEDSRVNAEHSSVALSRETNLEMLATKEAASTVTA